MQRAIVDGIERLAFTLDRADADEIQRAQREDHSRVIDADGHPVVLRAGDAVLWHFALRDGTTAPESAEHIRGKQAVYHAARAMGWKAHIEHRGPDGRWIADVLTEDSTGRRIAWEVQLAQQSEKEYQRRTQRYADDGIETVWISPQMAGGRGVKAGLLALPMSPLVSDLEAELLLTMSYLSDAGAVRIAPVRTVCAVRDICWRCQQWYSARAIDQLWGDKQAFSAEEKQVLAADEMPHPAYVKEAYSKQAGIRYPAWHCPYCHALQGDFFLADKRVRILSVPPDGPGGICQPLDREADAWARGRDGDLGQSA